MVLLSLSVFQGFLAVLILCGSQSSTQFFFIPHKGVTGIGICKLIWRGVSSLHGSSSITFKGGHSIQQSTKLLKERSYKKYCSFELKLQPVSVVTTKGLLSHGFLCLQAH